jgi:hypothetical protein
MAYFPSLDEAFKPYAAYLVDSARAAGIDLIIISGRRSSTVNREVGGAPRSFHLKGLAFDTAVLNYTREQVPYDWWLALGQFWESLGGRWGGRFNPPDVNHFDSGF